MHAAIANTLSSALSPVVTREVAALVAEAATLRQVCEIMQDRHRRDELEAQAMLIETVIGNLVRHGAAPGGAPTT